MIIHKQLNPSSFCFRSFYQGIYVRYFCQNMIHYLKWWRINPHLKWIIISCNQVWGISQNHPYVSRYSSIEVKSAYNQADFSQGTFFPYFLWFFSLYPPHLLISFILVAFFSVTFGCSHLGRTDTYHTIFFPGNHVCTLFSKSVLQSLLSFY